MVRCYVPIQIHTFEKNFPTTHMLNLPVSAHCGLEAVNYKAAVVKIIWEPKRNIWKSGRAWHPVCVWAGSIKSQAQPVQALLHLQVSLWWLALLWHRQLGHPRDKVVGSQIWTEPCLSSVLPALFLKSGTNNLSSACQLNKYLITQVLKWKKTKLQGIQRYASTRRKTPTTKKSRVIPKNLRAVH